MYGHIEVILQLSPGSVSQLLGAVQQLVKEVQRRAPGLSLRLGTCEDHTVAHLVHCVQTQGQSFPAFATMSPAEKSLLSKEERLFRDAFPGLNAFDCLHLAQRGSVRRGPAGWHAARLSPTHTRSTC